MKPTNPTRTVAAAACALLLGSGAARAQTDPDRGDHGDIVLEVPNLRSDRGVVRAALHLEPDGFPGDVRKVYRAAEIRIDGRTARARFPRVPAGDFAIVVFHDEDRDGRLDTGFLGIPKEGYGASRNDLPRFSAPSWKGNRLTLAAGQTARVEIRVRY
jgi:uncharacterized protein (DUF2141 family)